MGITKIILKRPSSAVMILLAIAVFGITSLFGFKMALIPNIEMPIQLVMVTYPGADPKSVDELVTTKIEGAVESLSGVKTVSSYSRENVSMIVLQYDYGTDTNKNFLNLRAALDGTKASLPDDCKEPVIMEINIDSMPSVMLTATSDNNTDILAFLDDGMKKEIEALSSVAQVNITGGKTDYIRVLLKEDMLNQFGLSMSTVSSYIAATDFMIPIGSLDQGSQSLSSTSSADN
ncbi:MAG: efflux RND transporter permease subunit, partial [Lachnospiraceae bacterium]|nr:efflux RND transporter permease subunit [Lachnospiraceae bacterium]